HPTPIEGLFVVRKKVIRDHRGSVMHMLRDDLTYFDGQAGEIYFSTVAPGVVKGWKKHRLMHQRFTVPSGKIRFVFIDEREASPTKGEVYSITLHPEDHRLLLVPNELWYAFRGESSDAESVICNCASMPFQ